MELIIDMMGGDNGTQATKQAVIRFQKTHPDCTLTLLGDAKELADLGDSFTIIPTTQVVKMESGVMEVLRLRDSSLVRGMNEVINRKADGIVSCGSTGAFLASATLILKKIPGVYRPALCTQFPHLSNGGFVSVLDVGASNENTKEELAQFAFMGSLYSKFVNNISSPKVALLSNGAEKGKGCPEGKDAYPLIEADKRINFIGNIEASNIFYGPADVVVADGYSGNVLIKATEGAAKAMGNLTKQAFKRNFFSKIGYLLSKKGFASLKDTMNPKTVGGALLEGVNAVAVKGHGNSDAEAFYHAIDLAYRLAKNHIVDEIKKGFANG